MYYRFISRFIIIVIITHSSILFSQSILHYKNVIDYYDNEVKSTVLDAKGNFLKDGQYYLNGDVEDFDFLLKSYLGVSNKEAYFLPNDSLVYSGTIKDSLKVGTCGIYADGKVIINTSYPKETTGEVKTTGKIEVVVEFKAWAKAGIAYLGFEGEIKANATTSVTGGIKVGADKKGIYASPIAEFGGLKATFIAIGTIKFGVFKRTLTYEGESRLVAPDEIKFEKYYLDFSKTEK